MEPEAWRIEESLKRIADWYRENRRPLPWRLDPTPYHVWLSEIMLQQTRIEAAIPYYERFLKELPDISSLASVEDDRLMKLWEGLGYYSRARNLKKAAVQVMEHHNGVLPRTARELRELAGIGAYTAGAIASIAYGEPEPAVDGNVLRVLTRLLAWGDDIAQERTRLQAAELLRTAYPRGQEAALVTEGIMELGETVCVPNGEARCLLCPLRELCLAHKTGTVEAYPVKATPKARRIEERSVVLLRCGDRWAVRRRREKGLLAGLWEFPNREGGLTRGELEDWLSRRGAQLLSYAPCGKAKHIFTHVEWHMTGYLARCDLPAEELEWRTGAEIRESVPIPTAFRFFGELLQKLDATGQDPT